MASSRIQGSRFIEQKTVILSEAYFSGVEGPAVRFNRKLHKGLVLSEHSWLQKMREGNLYETRWPNEERLFARRAHLRRPTYPRSTARPTQ